MLKIGKKKPAEANAVVPAEGEGAEGAPAKKKIPLLFIAIPAAVVLLGGGGAAAFFMMQPKAPADAEADAGHAAPKKKDAGHGAEKKGAAAGATGAAAGSITAGPDGVTFYTLPDMVVNIQGAEGRPSYLKLRLTLEMQDPALAEHLMAEQPRMQDMFQGFLRELRPEDLAGSAGSFQLRAEILRRVNLIAAPGKVDAVLIEEMLVN